MKNSERIIALTAFAVLFLATAQAQVVVMQPLTTFGTNGDGSLRPGDAAFLTSTSQFQRGLACNPTTGHLLIVDRSPSSGANNAVYILDGNTGATLGQLDNNSTLAGGNSAFTLNLVGVAEDGAIYVANLTSGTTTAPQVRLYRWASETDPEVLVYPPAPGLDDPTGGNTNAFQKRWGDTMTVRGSGLTTQVLLANRGTLAALFTPDDSSFSHFTPRLLTTDVSSGALGYGLTFGAGDSFWGTAGASTDGPLLRMHFDAVAGTATTEHSFPSPGFPGTITPILVMPSSNLLAGITMVSGADVVRLYDISNSNAPVLLDRKSFATNNNNNIFAGALALGTNGVLYALDSDNGIMAFALNIAATNPLAPAFFLNPVSQLAVVGGSATLTASADSNLPISYQWLFFGTNVLGGATNTSLTLTNLQLTNTGNYSVVAGNSIGSVTSSVAVLTVLATPPTTLLFYEPFNYASSQLLTAANPAWTLNGSGNDTYVASGNLIIPGLAASTGNSITNGGSGAGMRYPLPSTILDGELYYSFAFTMNSVGAAFTAVNSFISAFVDPAGSSTYEARLMPRTNTIPGQYNLGITKVTATGAGPVWATNNFVEGETLFIVARYTFNSGSTTDDQADLWINPDPATFGAASPPTPTLSAPQTGTDEALISQFTFRQNTVANTPAAMTFDELRIGLKWADVTPPFVAVPGLTIMPNGNGTATMSWPTVATGFNLEGATNLTSPISWTAVTNAVVVVGTNSTVNVNATSGNQFFRLKK